VVMVMFIILIVGTVLVLGTVVHIVVHSWYNDVIVRVAVVLDENTALFRASELNYIGVNSVDGGEEGLTVVHNNDAIRVVSCSSKLRVDVMANIDVTTDDGHDDIMRVSLNLRCIWLMMLLRTARATGELVLEVVSVLGILSDDLTMGTVRFVLVVKRIIHSWNNDIIMRVAIIGDEGTTTHIASKLELIRVDLIHRNNNGSSVDLNDGFGARYGSSGKLRVNMKLWSDVSTSLNKLNTVGTGLLFNMRVVALVRSLRNRSVVIVMFVMILMVVSLGARTLRVNIAAVETITERKMSLSVLEEIGTGGDHLGGKGELLTVKNDWASVILQIRLSEVALILNG